MKQGRGENPITGFSSFRLHCLACPTAWETPEKSELKESRSPFSKQSSLTYLVPTYASSTLGPQLTSPHPSPPPPPKEGHVPVLQMRKLSIREACPSLHSTYLLANLWGRYAANGGGRSVLCVPVGREQVLAGIHPFIHPLKPFINLGIQ